MRLWHIDILPFLPKSQLLAQWRELNSIFKKQDKHILINYVYDYYEGILKYYTETVIMEMRKRNIKIKTFKHYNNFFIDTPIMSNNFKEHNNEYLLICFFNLLEKYRRGQKDFDKQQFEKLYDFVNTKFDLKGLDIEKNAN